MEYDSKGPTTRGATDSANNATAGELSNLGKAVKLFEMRYNRFKALSNIPADMRAEYNSLASRAATVERTINSVFGGIDTVKGWIGLGALPLIPIAVASAAVAGIIAVANGLNEFMIRLDAKRMAADSNISYADALDRARAGSNSSGSWIDSIGRNITFPLIVGGLLLFLLRK